MIQTCVGLRTVGQGLKYLSDFNAKVRREDIFKPTIGNENLHEVSNANGARVVKFATSKNIVVKSTMFAHRSIHKYTWTSPDGKTHNQIDHILIDRRRHSSILDVRFFRGADCDSDHYLVVAKVRERLPMLSGSTVTTAWRVLGLRIEETTSRYGG
jgi:endonuclease/exonuclease/phosphatase family metal-dependent hydrolase